MAGWHVSRVGLVVELDPARVVVEGQLVVHRDGVDDGGPLVLDGRGLDTEWVEVDGRRLTSHEYTIADGALTIASLSGTEHAVRTRVVATPGHPGDKGLVWRDGILSSNCEPQGFRRITWSLDRPAERPVFDVTLIGEAATFPVMLANGDPVASEELDGGRHLARFTDPVPKSTYLFALVAGDLRTRTAPYTTRSGGHVELVVAAPPDLIDGSEYALHSMAAAMALDEATGGVEHDLDRLVFVALPGYPDATEYHGLMFFDPSVLVTDQRGFVDDDLLLIAANVAHEYGHHTRGNRVTVRTWGQLALKEGLTVLTAQNDFRRHLFGPVGRVLDVLDLRRLQFPEEVTIGAPVVRGEVPNPEALYNRTTYLKGAEIFSMLREAVGPSAWAAAFRSFVAEHDLGSAGVDDFLAAVREQVPRRGADIDGIARWFTRAGRPAIDIAMSEGMLTVTRTDSLADGVGQEPAMAMPIAIAFRSTAGEAVPVCVDGGVAATEHVLVLDRRHRSWSIDGGDGAVLSPLRRYTSPVDLRTHHTDRELATLLVHDDDPFVRWWASEELMIRVVDAHRAGAEPGTTLDVLAAALRKMLPIEQDPVLLAQLLAVPDEFMLGDREPLIDVDGVAAGLEFLRVRMGVLLDDALLAAWARLGESAVDGTDAASIGRRMLVEPILAPLLAGGGDDGRALALALVDSPNDTVATRALAQLAHRADVPGAPLDELLARTWARWQHAPKLVDRWLRAQSGSRRGDTIARVHALAHGPLYDRGDRSRVMSVWFPFATRNRVVFHDPSGEGYRIFVDELTELMPVNAGLAVRLVGDLLQFQRFDPHRRELLRAELERMAGAPGMPEFAVGIIRSLLAAG